jgi:hypothetical protein
MADNTTRAVTSGGDTIRDLDRSGIKTPIGLVDIAQSGESELTGLGDSRIITATSAGLTTASTSYTAGDQLGTELTLSSILRAAKGCTIQSAVLIDKAKVVGAVDLFLFSAATTPASDNAANSWSDADMANLIGVVHFTDVMQSANNVVVPGTNLPIVLKPGSGTSIFGDLVTRTGHGVFGATTDLIVALGVTRD